MKKPTTKQEERKKRWGKRICIKDNQHKYLKVEQKRLKYKTLAGTLDYIINKYKQL